MSAAGWRECKLGDLFEVKHGFAFKGEFFSDVGELVLLTPGNFRENGGLKLKGEKEKFYTGEFPAEFLLRRGDLLIAMTDLTQNAPILGSPAFIPEDGRFLHNQRLGKVINLRRGRIEPKYLFYLLNTERVREQIKASASGATVRHTSPSRIADVGVGLPPLPLQRRIASMLSAYDELIENSQRRITILEASARGLYREWCVLLRLPGSEEASYSAADMGTLPEGWSSRPLASLVEFAKGRKPSVTRVEPADGDVPVLLIDTLKGGRPTFASPSRLLIAHKRDTLMVMDGASSCDVAIGHAGAVGSTLGRFRPVDSQSFSPLALYWFLETHAAEFKEKNVGAAIPHASKDYILSQCVALPPKRDAARLSELLEPLHGELELLKMQVQVLRRTRDLLLPRLLSGQVTLDAA